MPRQLICLLLVSSAALTGAPPPAVAPRTRTVLQPARHAESDLEITGLVRGLAPGEAGYLSYHDLLGLPQTRFTVTGDENLGGAHAVSGVLLETLAKSLDVLPQSDLIDALCTDRYRSHYPAEYVAQHHPLLVLTIDGKPVSAWAQALHRYDPGPYLITYAHFVPSFKILAHQDEAQIPDNLVRLNFTTQAATFTPLEPRGSFAQGSPEQQGFTIAKQNCLRCHFEGGSGGTKSGRSWEFIGTWAQEQPSFFEAYVKNPQKFEPHSHMAANPDYDSATLAALAAYFRTFSTSVKAGAR